MQSKIRPPSEFVHLACNEELGNLMVASALVWVSSNFDEFHKYILDGITEPDVVELYQKITQDILDVWFFPHITELTEKGNPVAKYTAVGPFDLSDMPGIGSLLGDLLGASKPPAKTYGGKGSKKE